ncbi:MAG: hypothetical protein KDK70_14700 [Myxococcales bacterium]|nr:hypothetical protein [Myxococcales bacterium]
MCIPSRRLVSFTSLGLVVLTLGACVIPGTVGDDPEPGDTASSTGPVTDTESPGFTSAEPGTSSAASVSGGVTTEFPGTDGGDATDGALDPEAALDACGVPVEVSPGGPYVEYVECSGGCVIEVEAEEPPNLFDYGDCLCAVMQCGQYIGGGGTGPATGEDTGTGEPPDGCGPFPPGTESFTCTCEICSIDVNDVDSAWLANEADLEGICACMCGNTGCGMPL